jgi:hypothetical protein
MEEFLENLRAKSPAYRKRFAFITSSSVTALMFVIWAVSNFGLPVQSGTIANAPETKTVAVENTGPTPFESVRSGLVGAVTSAGPYVELTKEKIVNLDFDNSYLEMRDSAFKKYGR